MDPIMFIFGFGLLVLIGGTIAVLLPVYAGCYTALYWAYAPQAEGAHPVAGRFWEYEWTLAQYQQLVAAWQAGQSDMALQLFAPPVAGAVLGLLLGYAFYHQVRSQFSVDDL